MARGLLREASPGSIILTFHWKYVYLLLLGTKDRQVAPFGRSKSCSGFCFVQEMACKLKLLDNTYISNVLEGHNEAMMGCKESREIAKFVNGALV